MTTTFPMTLVQSGSTTTATSTTPTTTDDDEDGTADGSRTMMVDTNVNGNDGLADAIPTSAVSADDRDIVDDIVTTNAE